MSVFRHSKRDIFLIVYNPESGDKYQFTMRKEVLKEYLERSLNTGALAANELFIKSNMRLLSDQLMYRNRMSEEGVRHKVVVLSEKGGGERGKLCARKGKMISYGDGSSTGCIVSVYQYFKDYIFKAHNVETCEMMRTTLTDVQLKAWFKWTEGRLLRSRRSLRSLLTMISLRCQLSLTCFVTDLLFFSCCICLGCFRIEFRPTFATVVAD